MKTIATSLLLLVIGLSVGAQPLPWEETVRQSIARVVAYPNCPLLGPHCQEDLSAKVGTGFVVTVPDVDRPLLLTAYHVIVGSQRFSFEFTARPDLNGVTNAEIFKVNAASDIALLEIPQSIADRIVPLTFADYSPEVFQEIIVHGHKQRLLQIARDVGRATDPSDFSIGSIICQSRRKKGPFAGVKVGQLRCRALLGVLPIKLTRDKAHVGQGSTSIKFRPGSGSGVSALF